MRLVVPIAGQYSHEIERRENAGRDRRINAAGKHHVLSTQCDVLRRVRHRVSRAGATSRNDVRQTSQAKRHRQLARQSAVRRSGNRVDTRFAGWTNLPVLVLPVCEGEATAAGAELYTERTTLRQ